VKVVAIIEHLLSCASRRQWGAVAGLGLVAFSACRSSQLPERGTDAGKGGAAGTAEITAGRGSGSSGRSMVNGGRASAGEAGAGRPDASSGKAGRASGSAGDDAGAGTGGTTGWLYDPSSWTVVDTLPECSTRVAVDPSRIFPGLSFSECGPGCREARVMPGNGPSLAAKLGTSARFTDGALQISLSTRIEGDRTTYLLGTYSFGDGKPSVLIAEDGKCLAQLAGRGSLSSFRVFRLDGDFQYRLGWFDRSVRQLRWADPPLSLLIDAFDFDSGWGGLDAFSELLVAPDPSVAVVASVYATPGSIFYPFSNGLGVVLTEWFDGTGRILGWRPGREVLPIATGTWRAVRIGASPDRVAWLGATGERAADGLLETATVYSCASSRLDEPCVIDVGPTLPINSTGGVLATQGRFIALNGCVEAGCDIYLIDWTNSDVFRVNLAHAGHGVEVIGLSNEELFVADFSETVRGTSDFDGLIRYDLSRLTEFATRL
jgi:hypothetical protein